MQLRKRNLFTTIRAEGSILPADMLQHINERDAQLKGLTPDDYHLAGGLKLNEAINHGIVCKARMGRLPERPRKAARERHWYYLDA